MSVGNQTQAVDFEGEQLTLVLGENLDQGGDDSGSRNGTGKTTIINASKQWATLGNFKLKWWEATVQHGAQDKAVEG